MAPSSRQTDYFPFSIQLTVRLWRELALGTVADTMRVRRLPTIIFFRELALRLTKRRQGAPPVQAGMLNLHALQRRIFRHVIQRYVAEQCPGILPQALAGAGFACGSPELAGVAHRFCELFPGTDLLDSPLTPAEWLAADGPDHSRKIQVSEELLLLRLAAENRALDPFREILDDSELAATSDYRRVVAGVERELAGAPAVGSFGLPLMELLRQPLRAAPTSLYEQMEFIRQRWAEIIPDELMVEVQTAFTVVHEEGRIFAPHGEPGGAPVLEFGPGGGLPAPDDHYPEHERFSADVDWMPNVVLIAKMVYVWLGQLSLSYGREINRLDQIPDAELDKLARWGFTGLWLIGIWERSRASQAIKRISGNAEAISSAYSLFDYTIAADLGGWEALANLRDRALARGIRLASDMVPNHTGIYSKWTIEHPDWFVQVDYPPYPTYSFNGPDLSSAPEVSLHIEDGYWDKSEAAVVFKHYDHRDGRTRYIYHGNDGTSIPWNDTAQLNYLNPEVREAVIRTILHVAHSFPIIRFDAAMTLAKKHYQRLWYPQPGGSGVPSRAEHGMSRAAFDAAMPEEFWRQVVDRVAAEVPDTLLLAEAFWLMEGYFVRTLGMHRVYNSAFMNMLKMEENAKYRQTIKNVLEYDHRILQRFVNFMNNPDERTAVEQFGKEKKYFGAAVLLVTMPGLPMIGHGQVEGFHEKYGMEYKRACWDEPVDEHLVAEHEARIFPLMRRRRLFSGSENFVLYDFFVEGAVNEDVFAYSNRHGDERGLILFHNRYSSTAGWLKTSTARAVRNDAGETALVQTTIGEALGVNPDGRHYYAFRDMSTGLEYIRHGREIGEKGLFVELEAYEFHAFFDFRDIYDDDFGTWGKLCFVLEGRGVPSIDEEVKLIRYGELIARFRELCLLLDDFVAPPPAAKVSGKPSRAKKPYPLREGLGIFLEELSIVAGVSGDVSLLADELAARLALLPPLLPEPAKKSSAVEAPVVSAGLHDRMLLALMVILRESGRLGGEEGFAARSAEWFAAYGLRRALADILSPVEGDETLRRDADRLVLLVDIVLSLGELTSLPPGPGRGEALRRFFADFRVRRCIRVHRSRGVEWFVKEPFEALLSWCRLLAAVVRGTEVAPARKSVVEPEPSGTAGVSLEALAAKAGYGVEAFLARADPKPDEP
ncbi:MAG: alpha-amylase [Desulfuromonadales bacterium]|nr:MAG: alpha-amylase [Desulfuromonadales bacterium]